MTIVLLIGMVVLSSCVAPAAPTSAPALPTTAATQAALPATGATPTTAAAAPAATTAPATTAASNAAPAGEASLSVYNDPTLGPILVDSKGMTLYMFTKDGPDKTTCTGTCLQKWPPLVTQGNPTLGPGIDASLVGSTTMADGRKILTYNHMPLYYWWQDKKPGDTKGQDVGQVWFVVSPKGDVIKTAGANANGNANANANANANTNTNANANANANANSANPAAAGEASLSVYNDPTLGPILVGDKGMTVYIFQKDEADKSNCNAQCQQKWPPLVTTQGAPKLGAGIDASMIGTAALADGRKIVTYNHMPLYYWYQDSKPGDTNGQGVGDVWFVVSPQGKAVEGGAAANPAATTAPAAAAPAASAAATITVFNDPKLGPILVGDKGMTLYIFQKDTPGKSNCNAACLQKWPALIAQGTPTAGQGVDASLIGTATLADGRTIVTYNQMPLYYFANDAKPGDTNGQGVGSVWWVISPAGTVVGAAPAAVTAPQAMPTAKPYKNKKDSGGYGPTY